MRTFIYDRPFPPLFGIPIAAGKLFQKKKGRKEAPVFFCVAKPTSFPTDLQLTLQVKNLQKQEEEESRNKGETKSLQIRLGTAGRHLLPFACRKGNHSCVTSFPLKRFEGKQSRGDDKNKEIRV